LLAGTRSDLYAESPDATAVIAYMKTHVRHDPIVMHRRLPEEA